MPRGLIALGVGVLTMLVATGTAFAEPGTGGGQGSAGRSGDVITAAVSYSSVGEKGGGRGASDCSWELVDEFGVTDVGIASWPLAVSGVTYHLYRARVRAR